MWIDIWRISVSLGLLWLLSGGAGYLPGLWHSKPQARSIAQANAPAATRLALSAAGHVVGFAPTGWHLTNGQYALSVTFVAATPTQPSQAQAVAKPRVGGAVAPTASATLKHLAYRNLWAGITLAYTADAAGIMRSTYTLAPGASVSAIRLRYNVPVAQTPAGDLRLNFATGTLYETAPIAWQEVQGQRQMVAVQFVQHSAYEVGFAVGAYDPRLPLIIDPVLRWNTFLGGSNVDVGYAIAVDANNNVYVAGYSGASWGNPVQAYGGAWEGFVAKLNGAGALQWNTFVGGSGNDYAYGIEVDSNNNVYVSGLSDATWGSPLRPYSGGPDAWVARLNAVTGARTWNTFLGSDRDDVSYAKLAVDTGGNVYVAGHSEAVWGTPVLTHSVGSNWDAFIVRLAPSGVISWNTFLGATSFDYSYSVASDGSSVYVLGYSDGSWGLPIRPFNAPPDAFLARLNATSGALDWNTFLGGTGADVGYDLALGSGVVYVSGYSDVVWGNPVRPFAGAADGFVARVTANGSLSWNTFLGGNNSDFAWAIDTDTVGNLYVGGYSHATWGTPIRPFSIGPDAFVARVHGTSGVLGWTTFLGGNSADEARDIAAGANSALFLAGYSSGTWGTPLLPFNANNDAYVVRLTATSETYLPLSIRAMNMGLPISQTFESGLMPPTNWTRLQTAATTWVASTAYSHLGAYSAYVAPAAGQNEVLLSPIFTANTAQVSFWALGSRTACVNNNLCDLNVWLVLGSGWDGGTVDDVLLYNAESDWTGDFQWVQTTVAVPPPFLAGQTARIGIQYVNNNGAGLAVDDITLLP